MSYAIDLMVEEHANINRMLKVMRSACIGILDGAEPDTGDFRKMVDFTRNYSDKHHHGKEEKLLFPEMVSRLGRVAENLVTHGMLVEHDLGRGHVVALNTALDQYDNNPDTGSKLDIITETMGYANLLKLHTEKENGVVYPFATSKLPQEVLDEIDEKSRAFEAEEAAKGVQEKYLAILKEMEEKYLPEKAQ